ncbi:MAG: hypothetical protein L6428_06440, partial [Candidatus Aminicenantes bacterium]|nr:hypothetical protein [Candidatus Aminicenantes bacterium]
MDKAIKKFIPFVLLSMMAISVKGQAGDAKITSQNGVRNLSYKVHRSVDDRKEIITSCSVTTGSVNEAHVLEKA